ncbi:SPOSA6832_03453 [Sporobolomyces salmonicolor]|uniref:SPOSA6832_03453-mRNA-1:cds n=1 Tax=Sporidiobolus salmonicolor TaxID=5005 RepID=A0A0D6EPD0_SPOSA|nr:SPOSA6832_03453 [Sporobolomyces salmonicolor]
MPSFSLVSAAVLLAAGARAEYSLVKDYSGDSFFNGWSYYGSWDNLTNGDVNFVNQSASTQLAYVNDAGRMTAHILLALNPFHLAQNAIIKVDNTSTVLYPNKRDTVRIQSTESYDIGSLFVFDAVHVPYGCSVWPAPNTGEIDTFEAVNLMQYNEMALHTTSGCMAPNSTTSDAYTGTLTYNNCDYEANANSGCTVLDPSTDSYGEAFATAGGGVWATELANTGIRIWFFTVRCSHSWSPFHQFSNNSVSFSSQREKVPSDLLSTNTSAIPDPSSWGEPTAYFPSSSCNIADYFEAQHLVVDITLCGDWAGNNATLSTTGCALTTQPACYQQYVLDSSNYDTAYFEIPSIRVYNDPSLAANRTGSSSSNSSSSDSNNKTSGAAASCSRQTVLGAVAAGVMAVAGWTVLGA